MFHCGRGSWFCPHCGFELDELGGVQAEELEEGEWIEAPEFCYCDVVSV